MNSIEKVSSGNGYTCEKCEKKFDSIVSRKLHSLDCTVVPIIPGLKKDVVCPVVNCRSAFYTHERLTLHVREDHDFVCSKSNHDYGLREVYFNQQSDFTDWFTNICQKYEYRFVKAESPLPNTQVFTCGDGDGDTKKRKQFCPAFVKLKSEDNGRFTCTFSFIHAFHGFCPIPIIEVPKGNFCFVIKNKKQLPNYDHKKTSEAKTSENPEGHDTDVVFLSKSIGSSQSFTSPIGITDEAELSLKPGVRVENLWDMPDYVSNLPLVAVPSPNVQNGTEDGANHLEKITIAPCFLKFSKNLLPPPLLSTNHPTTLIPLTLGTPSFSKRHDENNTEQNLIKRSNDQCRPISSLATDDSRKASYLGSSLPCVSNTTPILPAADIAHEKTLSSAIQCQADRAYEEKRASLNNALNSMNAHDTDVANELFNNRTVADTDKTPQVNEVNAIGERLTFKPTLKPSGQTLLPDFMEQKKANQKKFGHERALEEKFKMEKTIENLVASVKAAAQKAVEKKRSVKNKAIKDKAVKERTAREKAAKERAAEKKVAKHRTAKEETTKDDGFDESSVDETMEEGRSSNQTVSSPNFNSSGQVRGTGVQARYLLRKLPNYVPARGYSGRKRKASPDDTENLGQQTKPNLRGRVGRLSVLPSRKISLNEIDISKLPEPIQKVSIDMKDLKNSESFSSLLPIDISSENYSLKYQSMRNFHRIKEAGVLLEMFTDSDLPYDLETATLLRETEANMDRIVRKLSSRHSETLKQRHRFNVESHIAEKNLQS